MTSVSKALCVLLLWLVLPSSLFAQSWLKIGAWNIENLGDRNFGQNVVAIAEHIRLSGVDILALQEIHDTDEQFNTRTNVKLDEAFVRLNQEPGQSWEYLLFEKRRASDTERLIGIAWNSEVVSMIGQPYRIPVDNQNGSLWDRHPYAVKFSTSPSKSDLVLIPVHMKSNVGGSWSARRKRAREAQALVARLPSIRTHFGEELDLVILGDTNCKNGSERAIEIFQSAGFTDLNQEDRGTFVTGGPFDRIFVLRSQQEFRYSQQYNLLASDPSGHDSALSDHQIILTSIRILDDDD